MHVVHNSDTGEGTRWGIDIPYTVSCVCGISLLSAPIMYRVSRAVHTFEELLTACVKQEKIVPFIFCKGIVKACKGLVNALYSL